jgi:hypothetical protein
MRHEARSIGHRQAPLGERAEAVYGLEMPRFMLSSQRFLVFPMPLDDAAGDHVIDYIIFTAPADSVK